MTYKGEDRYKVMYIGDSPDVKLNGTVNLHSFVGPEQALFGLAGRIPDGVELRNMDALIVDFLPSIAGYFVGEIVPDYSFKGKIHVVDAHNNLQKVLEQVREDSLNK